MTKRESPEERSTPPAGGHSRRSFLRRAGLAGGTAVVVSAGGLSYRAYGQGVLEEGGGGAYDAWHDWEKGRGSLALVSAAILAANPGPAGARCAHRPAVGAAAPRRAL